MRQEISPSPTPHRSKTVAALLALAAGFAGAHRLYLGARLWWIYPLVALPAIGWALRAPEWFRHPGFFVAALVVVVALAEAIVFALTPDEKWDLRRNAASGRRSASRWPTVMIAIVALMLGAALMMSVMAIALEGFFVARHPQLR